MDRDLVRDRVVADVAVLARAQVDLETFAHEAMQSLQRAVPHDGWSLGTLDPASLMPTGVCLREGCAVAWSAHDREWARLEYGQDDPTSVLAMARSGCAALGVHDVTGGDLSRSPRMRDLMSPVLGCADELRALATDGHRSWGAVFLYRLRGHFEPWEVSLVEALCPSFARAVRRGVLGMWAGRRTVTDDATPTMVVLDARGEVVLSSPGGVEQLVSLHHGDGAEASEGLLASLAAAAAATRATKGAHHPTTRVRLADGRWCTVHATPLGSPDGDLVGVTITESRPRELLPLVVDALGMTPRERDVLVLVVRGADTRSVAEQLHMSSHTVQDHLKAIFAKAGVHSRRELTALVLGDQLDPAW